MEAARGKIIRPWSETEVLYSTSFAQPRERTCANKKMGQRALSLPHPSARRCAFRCNRWHTFSARSDTERRREGKGDLDRPASHRAQQKTSDRSGPGYVAQQRQEAEHEGEGDEGSGVPLKSNLRVKEQACDVLLRHSR